MASAADPSQVDKPAEVKSSSVECSPKKGKWAVTTLIT